MILDFASPNLFSRYFRDSLGPIRLGSSTEAGSQAGVGTSFKTGKIVYLLKRCVVEKAGKSAFLSIVNAFTNVSQ